jgi:hypothetical protein
VFKLVSTLNPDVMFGGPLDNGGCPSGQGVIRPRETLCAWAAQLRRFSRISDAIASEDWAGI